jgi:hypothetical protein
MNKNNDNSLPINNGLQKRLNTSFRANKEQQKTISNRKFSGMSKNIHNMGITIDFQNMNLNDHQKLVQQNSTNRDDSTNLGTNGQPTDRLNES